MKYPFAFLISMFIINSGVGQEILPLYPKGIPNSKPTPNTEKTVTRDNGSQIVSNISVPTLTLFIPPRASSNGAAVIICPGGGYRINAVKHEGTDIAKKLNEWGVAAFVLKYRLPNDETMIDKEIGPLQDAQQAIRLVRENADKWNIDPDKTGIMGFSAGGHLAATAATHFNKPVIADAGQVNLRPDFLVLGYPVISFTDTLGHIGSRTNLLGESPSREKILAYSNEHLVTSETPVTFLVHAGDDKSVPPGNSIAFYQSLLKHEVPAELHIYERGGHGFGMDNPTTDEKWMETLRNWLETRGIIE